MVILGAKAAIVTIVCHQLVGHDAAANPVTGDRGFTLGGISACMDYPFAHSHTATGRIAKIVRCTEVVVVTGCPYRKRRPDTIAGRVAFVA